MVSGVPGLLREVVQTAEVLGVVKSFEEFVGPS